MISEREVHRSTVKDTVKDTAKDAANDTFESLLDEGEAHIPCI